MFTVKATYNGETRKLSLDGESFPSYECIHSQLLRVFPVFPDSYYLSHVLFSPAEGPRVPIGKEIRNEAEYNERISRFIGRLWPKGLLRFTVMDDPEFELPGGLAAPTDSTAHIQQGSSGLALKDCDSSGTDATPSKASIDEIKELYNSVYKAKNEMKDLLGNFIEDLDKIITNPDVVNSARISANVEPGDQSGFSSAHKDNETMDVKIPGAFLHGTTPEQHGSNMKTREQPWQQPEASSSVSLNTLNTSNTSAPDRLQSTSNTHASQQLNSVEGPIHANVLCDRCCNVIVGHRHKCLDCRDYDLCDRCFPMVSSIHSPFHEFFTITEPGRVVVHTVDGRGRVEARTFDSNSNGGLRNNAERRTVSHGAICDLCDSRIYGVRYKCLNCPDFDTCNSCHTITSEQHPTHTFVKIEEAQNLSSRDTRRYVKHSARCDECKTAIYGTRYKCMHPDCPDYDLCARCEAMPIEVHPSSHPMLKMRTPDSFIPLIHHSDRVHTLFDTSRSAMANCSRKERRAEDSISLQTSRKAEFSEASVHVAVKPEVADASVHTECIRSKSDASTATEHDMNERRDNDRHEATIFVAESSVNPEPLLSSQTAVDKLQEMASRWKESAPSMGDIDAAQEISRVISSVPALISDLIAKVPQPTEEQLLSTFVSDANINDGQEFPAGAEFVKTWQVRNDGRVPWPESTRVIFVAGDRMPAFDSAPLSYHIGAVDPGVTIDVAACDMKAPDVQGKYVGYWRLSDGSKPFGQSFWCDITVPIPERTTSSNDSLTASEVVMPDLAQAHPVSRQTSLTVDETVAVSLDTHTSASESHFSDDDSSIFLLDDLDSTSDEEFWETSRRNQTDGPQEPEYVLCEGNTDDE